MLKKKDEYPYHPCYQDPKARRKINMQASQRYRDDEEFRNRKLQLAKEANERYKQKRLKERKKAMIALLQGLKDQEQPEFDTAVEAIFEIIERYKNENFGTGKTR